ncbi:hypothetical protein LJB42_003959 [Komagataella kurtzmanii]|nr:hypothetical protein LJB42_003959 [Komagataella kurtzmanii]
MINHILILLTHLCLSVFASEKFVDISLKANWFKTPFPLLLLETVASENESGFYTILDAMFDVSFESLELEDEDLQFEAVPFVKSDEELYEKWSHRAGASIEKSITDIYLANKYYAPRVQSHYQHYNEVQSSILGDKCGTNPKAWLYFNNEVYCNSDDVFALKTGSKTGQPQILPFDRLIGIRNDEAPVAIIYGDYRSPLFSQFISNLAGFVKDGRLRLAWRYIPDESVLQKETLAGYGVDLTLKRTDYIVIDDRDIVLDKSLETKPIAAESDNFWDVYSKEIEHVSEKDIRALGYKLSLYIKSLEVCENEKLAILTKLIQDFPKYASFIDRQVTDTEAEEIIEDSWENSINDLPQGVYINGAVVDQSKLNYMEILNILKREYAFIDDITKFGVTGTHAQDIMKRYAAHISDRSVNNTMFKRFDIRGHGEAVFYLNDIETDPQYSGLSSSRKYYTTSVAPGEIPPVRENIHESVFVIDLADHNQVYTLLQFSSVMLSNRIPQRVGFVPLISDKLNQEITLQFLSIFQAKGINQGMKYLHDIAMNVLGQTPRDIISVESITKVPVSDKKNLLSKINEFISSFSIDHPLLITNGKFFDFVQNWQYHSAREIFLDILDLSNAISSGALSEDMRAQDYIYLGSHTSRNVLITNAMNEETNLPSLVSYDDLEVFESISQNQNRIATVVIDGQPDSIPITSWLLGNCKDKRFLQQLRHLITAASDLDPIKIKVYETSSNSDFSSSLQTANKSLVDVIAFIDNELEKINVHSPDSVLNDETIDFVHNVFKIKLSKPNDMYLILNGRAIKIRDKDKLLKDTDLKLLVEYEIDFKLRIAHELFCEYNISEPKSLDTFELFEYFTMGISNTYFFGDNYHPDQRVFPRYNTGLLNDAVSIEVSNSGPSIMDMTVIIDPLREESQKLISLLSLFEKLESLKLNIILKPQEARELNIKRFYRGVFPNSVKFTSAGDAIDNEDKGLFTLVPEKTLFTLDLDVPNPWIVAIKEAETDLDNVLLENSGDVTGVYELKSLLVEGYALEKNTKYPPVALPIELVGHSDTSIMANYGYFQLQANPGLWKFAVKPRTRGSDIYRLANVTSKSNGDTLQYTIIDETAIIFVLDMNGNVILPVFDRKPGLENASLIGDTATTEKDTGLSKFLSSWRKQEQPKNADINIFTVASGHLYERFLSIMTNSVMKHTKHTVKFWLIENYMSPTFKKNLPFLAQEFGFDYELVNYKWPAWLRGQREKQRTIWGYKILFLDVLFPQSLDKVIFVDADQIVRTDLKELVDLDLEGAPYGYTPMCNDREEMEGFRFWKQGYWQKVLGDTLKYHISALYVIDLKTFRQIAAGDRLRQHYQQLSQDPNSLSNLDQDLPNNLQHQIKIFSLPQEWLWCETWCSDESLKKAKTIDLCNNPLTKEPKLDRARRQIPEWTQYDDEVQQIINEASASARETITEHDEL